MLIKPYQITVNGLPFTVYERYLCTYDAYVMSGIKATDPLSESSMKEYEFDLDEPRCRTIKIWNDILRGTPDSPCVTVLPGLHPIFHRKKT